MAAQKKGAKTTKKTVTKKGDGPKRTKKWRQIMSWIRTQKTYVSIKDISDGANVALLTVYKNVKKYDSDLVSKKKGKGYLYQKVGFVEKTPKKRGRPKGSGTKGKGRGKAKGSAPASGTLAKRIKDLQALAKKQGLKVQITFV